MDYEKLNDSLLKGSNKTMFYAVVVPVNPLGQVLLAERKEDGIWTTPAGGAQLNETPEQAAIREAWEEAGLVVIPSMLEPMGVKMAPNGKPVHCFLVRTNQENFTVKMDPDKEVAGWSWYSYENLPEGLSRQKNANRLETVSQALMKFYGLSKGKDSKIVTPAKEMVEEHEHLVDVLNSPSHKDDKKEAKKQGKELKEYKKELNKGQDKSQGYWVVVGTKVEMEHTKDREKARKIALDHLHEDPDYYKDWDAKEKILFQEKAPKVEKSVEDSLIEKLAKGGPGSGVKGHMTAKKPGQQVSHPGQAQPQVNKVQAHLKLLKEGAVLPGVHTKSGKPIVTSTEAARAQGYSVEDYTDAMNVNYNMAKKVNDAIAKMRMAGKEPPKEAVEIAKFHEKQMKASMKARDQLEERAAAQKKQSSVKKSVTQMGSGLGDRDLDVGAFAQAQSKADDEWMERIHAGMQDHDYGDEPRSFQTPKGVLHLCKVDDGIYSGFFTKEEQVDDGVLADNAKVRIERMTIPELVMFMMAKEWIVSHLTQEADDSLKKLSEAETPDERGHTYADAMNAHGAVLEAMDTPEEVFREEASQVLAEKLSSPTADQRIRILELVTKLIG